MQVDVRILARGIKTDVLLIESLNYEFILGSDIMCSLGLIVDFETCQLADHFGRSTKLGQNQNLSLSVVKKQVTLDSLLEEYSDVFGELKIAKVEPVKIELISGARPFTKRLYRHSLVEKEFLRKEIKMLLDKGIVEPSSEWCSPVVLAEKGWFLSDVCGLS